MGFLMPNGLSGEAVESNSVYARSSKVGPANLVFRCKAIFLDSFCPLLQFITTLFNWKFAENVFLLITLSIAPECPNEIWLREKSFSPVFREKSSRHSFSRRFFVSGIVFFHLTPNCQNLENCCPETDFDEQRLTLADL